MATAEAADPVRALNVALAALDEQQRDLDERQRELDRNRAVLSETLSKLSGGKLTRTISPSLSVGEEHRQMVDAYLKDHVQARQADIVEDLDLNSGTVSVALRVLERDQQVKRLEKDRGSQVWMHLHPNLSSTPAQQSGAGKGTAAFKKRATVLEPGVGAREGRKIAA